MCKLYSFEERIRLGVLDDINSFPELKIIYDGSDMIITEPIKLSWTSNPTTKEIRLALDLLNHFYPLYKNADIETKADFVKDIFKFNIKKERITKVKPFKDILFKRVIHSVKEQNGKYIIKTIKVRRK